ncbi:MAG TPA: tripartite tricarboxylate transporter substrate-binding protein [Candidatus Tectomicrobia bacterium]
MKHWKWLAWGFGVVMMYTPLWGGSAAWAPQKPIEFIIPAGPGGGADVMARFITPLVSKYNLSPQPLVAVNKSGGAGAEGFLYVKGKKGDPHVIVITLSNLFTTPLATGTPFSWKDFTPLARLALDEFVLWVHAESPYTTAAAYLQAAKEHPGTFKMGGTGTAQEDQIITVQLEKATGAKFIYVPFKGGGDVATNLVGKHVDSTVNNPNEAVGHWKAGRLRPLGIFDAERLALPDWQDIPTMKEQGYDVEYLMLRGLFGAPGIPKEAQDWYIDLLQKVTETPEWVEFADKGGLKRGFLTGPEFATWLELADRTHKDLMTAGGLLKK